MNFETFLPALIAFAATAACGLVCELWSYHERVPSETVTFALIGLAASIAFAGFTAASAAFPLIALAGVVVAFVGGYIAKALFGYKLVRAADQLYKRLFATERHATKA